MSGMDIRYTAESNVVMGTISLWKLRGRMPVKLHEKRKFYLEVNGTRYLHVLDIGKFGSTIEEYQFVGNDVKMCKRFKVRDMHHENGQLVVCTKTRRANAV